MNENIRKHVNDLFNDKPNTKRVNDIKDEIISNANDKYNDLVESGKTEEEALKNVISGIGDVGELVDEIEKNNPINHRVNAKETKKSAKVVTIAVALYILSFISMIITDELGMPDFVMASGFFLFGGAATCLLIYHYMSKPKYKKYDDTMIEEFKEWKNKNDHHTEIRRSITAIIWLAAVIMYFILSFTFGIWYISWVIFLIAVLLQNIVSLMFKLGEN